MMQLLLSYGTRPEYIKIKPLIKALTGKIDFRILFTGQHEDLCKFPYDYRVHMGSGNNRLDSVVESQLNLDDKIFSGITHTLVQGDTASAFSLAIASFHRGVQVIHLEAGLRTYDKGNPYPEEVYRQCISRIAHIHLCPTDNNANTLLSENVTGEIVVTGNTVLDNLRDVLTESNNTVVVTLHRRENHDIIDRWFDSISSLAQAHPDIEFILPIHPNPNVRKHRDRLVGVNVIEPLGHDDFLKLLSGCCLVISDSGGLQEECSFLKKSVIVCRKVTERPESVGSTSFLCDDPEDLPSLFEEVNSMSISHEKCPYGDGYASEKIVDYLQSLSKDAIR